MIDGLRGFATPQVFSPSIPDGRIGSGITLLVGPNNSGKSTIVEALAARKPSESATFNVGLRNRRSDKVRLEYHFEGDAIEVVRSVRAGTSEAVQENVNFSSRKVYIVPSRRHFNPYFGKSGASDRESFRSTYTQHAQIRSASLSYFEGRLISAERNHEAFNPVLKKLLPDLLDWSIDQNENDQYYLKFTSASRSHSSAGVGDGIVSAFVILSALYDSHEGETIVIDEPELSLHPQVQRRLCAMICEYARNRQIILATHSPYFVSPDALRNGATICRCWDRNDQVELFSASVNTDSGLQSLLAVDVQKPHVFGLDAREIFFVDDRVVVLEGQEDVVFWDKAAGEEFSHAYPVYGWGAGGASNVRSVLKLLRSLGYKKVVAVLDNDVPAEVSALKLEFAEFLTLEIPASDIRNKKAVKEREAKEGLLDEKNENVRPEHMLAMSRLLEEASAYMSR